MQSAFNALVRIHKRTPHPLLVRFVFCQYGAKGKEVNEIGVHIKGEYVTLQDHYTPPYEKVSSSYL